MPATKQQSQYYYRCTAIDPVANACRFSPQMFKLVATQQLTKRIDVALDFSGASSNYLYPLYGYDASFNYQPFAYRFAGPKLLGLAGGYTLACWENA